jgi:hypothetical protein
MLIRSQDKETLVNIETSIVLYISGTISKKYPISTSNGYAIGFYSTKAKAMKVLDMIQEAYCEFMAIRNGDMWCGKESVFQMPEDSEVEV